MQKENKHTLILKKDIISKVKTFLKNINNLTSFLWTIFFLQEFLDLLFL